MFGKFYIFFPVFFFPEDLSELKHSSIVKLGWFLLIYKYFGIFTYIPEVTATEVFAINACANNFWNVSNAHAKRMFLVTWVHSFTHVLHLSYHAFPCDREVGKVWCNWNKLNATLYTAHGVSKGELIFMFWWFWYRFSKNFSPRRRDLWNLNSS